MIEVVKIAHPLREITLEYERDKPELQCEKELIAMHLLKHDYLWKIKQEQDKLLYELGELQDELDAENKRFTENEAEMLQLYNEISFYAGDRKHEELVEEAKDRYLKLQERIVEEHKLLIAPFQEKTQVLSEAFCDLERRYNGEDGVDFHEYSKKNIEVCEHWETCSLDIVKYDDEEEALKEQWHKIFAGTNVYGEFNKGYGAYNERLRATYELSDKIKETLTNYLDKENILNSSLSESYANGTGDMTKRPFYFIPPEDPQIKQFKLGWGPAMSAGVKQLTFNITIDLVRNYDTSNITDQLALLQHFPVLMEKLVFSCAINIINVDGTTLREEEWKGDPIAMEWYSKLQKLPCSLFFFESMDARAYILMGDIKFDKSIVSEKGDSIGLSGEMLEEVCSRLYNACQFFLIFCHNTGFDPSPYIDAILADTGLPISLEQVLDGFKESLKGEIRVAAIPASPPETKE